MNSLALRKYLGYVFGEMNSEMSLNPSRSRKDVGAILGEIRTEVERMESAYGLKAESMIIEIDQEKSA